MNRAGEEKLEETTMRKAVVALGCAGQECRCAQFDVEIFDL